MINIGSDFSGIGAFDYACQRVFGIDNINNIFACDMDKFARQSYLSNHKAPGYYPKNVYDREIPTDPLDIYMTSPPCQGFSIAGKRQGSILFFNSHEFIRINKPRYFIFENVKGLLSHEKDKNNKDQEVGKTFQNWINWLGGKSVNSLPVLFPDENSVPYHIYWSVLNSKEHGVPQNRERVFVVGIRDDSDNVFQWPRTEPLEKRLKDVLEMDVPDKYFLSDKMVKRLLKIGTPFEGKLKPLSGSEKFANTVTTSGGNQVSDNYIKIVGNTNPSGNGMNGNVFDADGISPTLSTNKGEGIKVVCFGRSESEKKRRRDHFKKYGKDSGSFQDKELILKDQNYYDTLLASPNPKKEGLFFDGYKIRRLTPRECLRLQDFPESFKIVVSDSQAYKQAGNSITIRPLTKIISKFKF